MLTKQQALLTKEDFSTRTDLPEWLLHEYRTF
ncbi:MAG: YqcI/YcgG family protein, partial [Paenisporosarcina sp.]